MRCKVGRVPVQHELTTVMLCRGKAVTPTHDRFDIHERQPGSILRSFCTPEAQPERITTAITRGRKQKNRMANLQEVV